MTLYSIRGGSKEDLESRHYNIGIGISLGNKWFSNENIIKLTKWALKHTRESVIIYVADSIHAINVEVRNRIRYEKALEKTIGQGEQLLTDLRRELKSILSSDDYRKVKYVQWDEISTELYQSKVQYLRMLYSNDLNFHAAIVNIVKEFTLKEQRVFSEQDISRLGEYIIEELPECIARVPMGSIECDAYIYPYDGTLTEFVDQIQKGTIFPKIRDVIMDTAPKVLLVVR